MKPVHARKAILLLLLILCLVNLQTGAFAQKIKLEEGTEIRLRLMESITSATAKAGQTINFEVLDNVIVNDVIVVAEGASAWGTIVEAHGKKSLGRGGKLNFRLDYVKAVDGSRVPLRATSNNKGGGKKGATGAVIAASVLFLPVAAPLAFLVKGKNVEVPKGQHITAFVDGDRMVTGKLQVNEDTSETAAPRNAPQVVAYSQPAINSAALGTINVVSTSSGAEIEVDGVFYGNAPAMLKLPAGTHTVSVKHLGYQPWVRTVTITPGSSVTLQANIARSSGRTVRH